MCTLVYTCKYMYIHIYIHTTYILTCEFMYVYILYIPYIIHICMHCAHM